MSVLSSPHTSPTNLTGAPTSAAPGEQRGTIRIALRVLRTVIAQATLSVPGVAQLAQMPTNAWQPTFTRLLPHRGVSLKVRGSHVSIDLHLIVTPGANMVEVGTAVQEAVATAVERMLGIDVAAINVYIQNVV